MLTAKKILATVGTLALTGLAVSACGPTVAKAPASSAPAGTPAAPAASSPAASPSSSAPLSGPVGTTYTVTGMNDSGNQTEYSVTLVRVDQQATLGAYETLTNGSDHVTAAEFTVTGKTGQSSDDANSDAVTVGTDQQDYTPSFDTITAGTNFNSGDFNVTPGQSVTGWVAFELAPGVTMASVQWTPGIGGQSATWTLGS